MIEQNYIEKIYRNMEDTPNIIRGATNGDLEEIKAALERDPNCINETDPNVGVTALHIAAFDGDYALVDFLCDQPGIELWPYDNLGRPPWWAARIIGRHDICDRIMRDIQREINEVLEEERKAEQGVTPLRRPSP